MEPPRAVSLARERGQQFPGLSDLDVSRVAEIVVPARGATMTSIKDELGVSRTTAIRWLALMVAYGLLERLSPAKGRRGRPEAIYLPTAKLTEFVGPNSLSAVFLDFSTLSRACKHLDGARCRFDESERLCSSSNCPLLNTQ